MLRPIHDRMHIDACSIKNTMKSQEASMLEGVIERLPKAELHIHIEGSLSWILERLLHLS